MPIQYADYTMWQAQWFKGEVFARQMEYWKKQLAGMPEVLELPTDKPRLAMSEHRGSMETALLDEKYWEKMKWFSRQEGASAFMTVLAIYQVLLLRYTGQTDFGVGTPITNRSHVRLEGMIGFCVNTLIMRADLRGEPTFREVLARVRKATLEAFDHQDLPLEKLVEELSPERQISGSPLFQVTFTFMNGTAVPLGLPGVEVRPIMPETTTSKCDLALFLRTLGVGPDARVAIGVERGLEMVAGMVAVLKAGGTYVPLDLSYPPERLQFILHDSAPVALLVQGDVPGWAGGIAAGIHVIDLTDEAVFRNPAEAYLERAETGVDAECLAYVIYTSGSTGEPKGSE